MKHSFTFSSNTLRINSFECLSIVAATALIFIATPRIWPLFEKADFGCYYRVPYESSNNYWLASRWLRHAAAEHEVVIVGDSVVWGHYAGLRGTLNFHLDNQLGEGRRIANLGIDGLHPAAMPGLFLYYGRALRNHSVVLHLNLLWMSSEQHDLQVEEEVRFNHPNLVPQVFPNIPCYRPSLSDIVGVVLERNIAFVSWARHLSQTYFENLDLLEWTVQNPHENPLRAIDFNLPKADREPRSTPRSWREAGIAEDQNLAWLDKKNSFQWQSFKEALALLRSRGNRVFVVIGPFNEHMLSDENRERYRDLLDDAVQWLEEEGVVDMQEMALTEQLIKMGHWGATT